MSLIQNPHDRFFKETMTDPHIAQDFFTNYLPADLLHVIDLKNLALEKDSFIDQGLEEAYSDLLYKTHIQGKVGYLYFLFEHKSYQDPETPLQLLKYMVKIWEQKPNKKKAGGLPVIVPIVIYHGETAWRAGQNFSQQFADLDVFPERIKKCIPDYEYIIYDFSPLGDEEIKGGVMLRIFLELIRAAFHKEPAHFINVINQSILALKELKGKSGAIGYLETIVRYMLSARGDIEFEEVKREVQKKSMEGSDIIMTIAEKLIKEGMEKGIKEGMEKGMKEGMKEGKKEGIEKGMKESMEKVAKKMLAEGESIEKIARYTGLSRDDIEKLQ